MTPRPIAALAGALALAAAGPVAALESAQSARADARIRTVDYDPAKVVRLVGAGRTATQILFGADESVEHVALGDAAAWEVAAERHMLFVRPRAGAAPTNLIVATSRGTETRSYVFELVAGAAAGRQEASFVLQFRYPADQQAKAQSAVDAAGAALERRLARLRLDRAAVEGPRNLAYVVQGPAALQPSEISDNGRFTVLHFPGAQSIPAIYTVTADGSEALAAFDVRGEFVVVHGVAPALRLRQGHAVLCITNEAYSPQEAPAGSLTAARDVVRTDLGAPR